MTTAVQHRRGTTAEHAAFTGLEGEVTIDTTKDTAVIHDGTLAGGYPLAKENLANVTTSGLSSIDGASTASDDKFFIFDQSATSLKTITRAELNNAIEQDALANVAITGGTINGTAIGGTTPAAGAFTTLSASGAATLSGLTASTALALDGSKNIVSVTNTGTGSNVLATSPTLVTPALGTPSALVGTNITGTATSFNINGTVGATTPAAGAFTTLSASSTVSGTGFSTYLASPPAIGGTAAAAGSFTTLSASGNVTLSGGTANGVAYLNGSKVVTSGSALTFDGTNFATTGSGTFSGLLSRIHAQGTDAYITNTTTGKANTVMGFNDSGSTNGQGIPTGYSYYGSLQTYPIGFTSSGYLTNSISSTNHIWNITGSEQMRLTSTGLGIGTTSISSKLYVAGGTNDQLLRVGNTNAVGTQYISIYANGAEAYYNSVNTQNSVYGSHVWNAQNNGGTVERARINSSGNLLVGTTSTSFEGITVAKASATYLNVYGNTSNDGGILLGGDGIENKANVIYKPSINALQISANAASSYMYFNTAGNERARIDSSGNLLVGTTSRLGGGNYGNHQIQGSNANGGAAALVVYNSDALDNATALNAIKYSATTSSSQRFIQFYANAGAQAMGGIVGNGAENVQFLTLSDAREKENIQPVTGALARVCSIDVVSFDRKGSGDHVKAGFIAQNVLPVYPEYVAENVSDSGSEARYGITGGMSAGYVAELTAAIQELKAEFDAYKASHP